MTIEERAKQFMPFAALRGLPEALAAKERIIVPKAELSEDMADELDRRMRDLTVGCVATVTYYHEGSYIKVTGMVARIDENAGFIQIVQTKIPFEAIYSIESEERLV
ncbi:MAG: YolD-like family protein [Lachnospiraceae bacterium]|nr:YolD-like family protein [Lachnospiraceae bacterium]